MIAVSTFSGAGRGRCTPEHRNGSHGCGYFLIWQGAGIGRRTTSGIILHALEHLLSGTPIEDVSRLLGHHDISITIKSYAAWIKERQLRLEGHQQRVWDADPLHQRMMVASSDRH